ncbi:hypothetical protein HMI49_10910 [Corallococcus exercitus]|uniref:Uncharacterized protein n=1 Tax=Corallococcus exercitus TaxID=2316736 RepID=A0A7Y4KJ58_9BACT|nr:hypothetical protein [Corallococcus exercitus]NOK33709.1 hypothetical protein [Corallococcus exercitus]
MRMRKREWTRSADQAVEPWSLLRDVVLPGAVAGTLGAFVMALLACAFTGVLHGEPWRPAMRVAGLFFRSGETQGAGVALVGVLTHLAVAGGLATGFALLLPRKGTGVAALLLGELYSLGAWLLMTRLLLPFGSPPLAREDASALLLLLHLAFGAALGTVPAARGVLTRVDRLRHGLRLLRQKA